MMVNYIGGPRSITINSFYIFHYESEKWQT